MNNDGTEAGIYLKEGYHIPASELLFRTSRSGGPGGQHVNKVETRVELIFDLAHSATFSECEKAMLSERLSQRIDADGTIRIVSAEHRSQYRNRQETVERLVFMLQHAMIPRKVRKATRIPRSVNENRLKNKLRQSTIKQLRRGKPSDD